MQGQDRIKELLTAQLGRHRTILLVGGKGSGKTMLAKWLAEQLGADFYHVTEGKVDQVRETIEHSLKSANNTLYHFEGGDTMTNQAQNALLKFAEEPPSKAYITIGVENENNILPTIKSRAIKYTLDPYTVEELTVFGMGLGVPEWVIDVCKTPGELLEYVGDENVENPYNVAKTVVYKVGNASLQNVMTISSKIPKGYEVKFTDFLLHHLGEAFGELNLGYIAACVGEVVSTRNHMFLSNANKTNLLDMLLEKLWRLHREWNLHN